MVNAPPPGTPRGYAPSAVDDWSAATPVRAGGGAAAYGQPLPPELDPAQRVPPLGRQIDEPVHGPGCEPGG